MAECGSQLTNESIVRGLEHSVDKDNSEVNNVQTDKFY